MDAVLVAALGLARPPESRPSGAVIDSAVPAVMASCEPGDYSGRLLTQASPYAPGQPVTAVARVTSQSRQWCGLTTGCGYLELFVTDSGGGIFRRAAYSPRCHRYQTIPLAPGAAVSIAMNPLAGIPTPGLYRIWSGYAPPALVLVL